MASLTNYPCRYCVAPKRHPGCHSTCPDYAEAKIENDKINETIKKEKQLEAQQFEDIRMLMKRTRRKR